MNPNVANDCNEESDTSGADISPSETAEPAAAPVMKEELS